MEETIGAISTALGVGAISIIRVSGNKSIKIVNKIFKGKNLEKQKSHTIHYGFIKKDDEIIDEVLVTIMKNPKTFTKEDIVEINCHGGISTTNKILELLLENGIRLAEPGEFTKRAFLNGRIDLIKAESIMDLINSKTEKSRKLSLNGLTGIISREIKLLRKEILNIMAKIEVSIDYPEYDDYEEITYDRLKKEINSIKGKTEKMLKDSENGKIIKDGINVSIIGKPNVGKSSILNNLLKEEKAIVTNIEGTTRDIVEGEIILKGIKLNIKDTAGIRETKDIVEKIGVDKSIKEIDKSDLVLLVLNQNEKLTNEDFKLIKKIKNKKNIIILNKCDLKRNIEVEKLNLKNIVKTSTKNEIGIKNLEKKIIEIFNLEKIDSKDLTYLSNLRQINLLKKCLKKINEIEKGINDKIPIDIIEIDIKVIWDYLGEIIGQSYKEELLDQLFSQFCLGK